MVKKALKQDCRDLTQPPTNGLLDVPPIIVHKGVNNLTVQLLL